MTRCGSYPAWSRLGRFTPNRRIASLVASVVAAAVAALMLAAALAHADGDPASDVLLAENVFYPYSPPVSASLQQSLNAETAAAGRAGFPIKVALIQSPVDLGAIPSLFDRPQQYADFLEQEISFRTRQPLLVVMPNGYGIQDLSAVTGAAAASLARPTGSQSDDLARAAIDAVRDLATAAGHRLAASDDSPAGATAHRSTMLMLLAVAFAAIAAAGALIVVRGRGRSLWSLQVASRRRYASAPPPSPGVQDAFALGLRGGVLQPLLVAGLLLIFGGLLWAVARGLDFYGLTPVDMAYDLDQPPLLLVLVGAWLWYRSARR
jgi:hypothetical protein